MALTFTFANALTAPGNVTTGIAAWWRADYGRCCCTSGAITAAMVKRLHNLIVAQQPELYAS